MKKEKITFTLYYTTLCNHYNNLDNVLESVRNNYI